MNFQQIEYVLAVSETKSFVQAAEKCFITQSTLSTMIGRLEEELGITIFDRKSKPVTITLEGEQVIRQLRIISKETENLREVVNALKGKVAGQLKIGVIPTVAPYLLPLFLNDFMKSLPHVHFEISEITTERILEDIGKRELDIGIVSIPLDHPEIVEIPLYNEPFLLFDMENSVSDEKLDVSHIDCNRLWLLEEGHCLRAQAENICGLHENRTVNRNLNYKSGTIDSLLKFVHQNNGVTLIPLLAALDLLEKDRKYLRKFAPPVPVRTIGVVVHNHFVKKAILEMLQLEIQEKVLPLLNTELEEQAIIPPVHA